MAENKHFGKSLGLQQPINRRRDIVKTNQYRRTFLAALTATMGMSVLNLHAKDPIKIGFLVKMPEQPWFISEQKAAAALGKTLGFSTVDIGTPDGEKVMSAIDNLASQGVKGFVICAPDVRLGTAIWERAKKHGMTVVSVDDQLVNSAGKPIAEIPHLGMSGYQIGLQVGQTLVEEIKKRGWKMNEVGALRISSNELPTAKERTTGATDNLLKAGFPKENIFEAPQKTTDTEGGFNAAMPVLTKQSNIKKWVVFALNEDSVLGGIRATEQLKIPAENVAGVGINGAAVAWAEFQKSTPTGFVGTVAVSSTMHGSKTAEMLFNWLDKGVQPPPLTLTSGVVATRENWKKVKKDLDL